MEHDDLLSLQSINAERRKAVPPLQPLTQEDIDRVKAMIPTADDRLLRKMLMHFQVGAS